MPVTDLSDTRVLIPRVRRALEGPSAPTGSAAIVAGNLSDDEINAVIADSVAEVIFYTGGLFGHTLNVVSRDAEYMAPDAWTVDPDLTEAEATVIVAQAAINHFFHYAKGLKTQERIADEAQEWQYQRSAQVISDWIKHLREMRDQALAQIEIDEDTDDAWVSFIAVRDAETAQIIEPYVYGQGYGGQGFDSRFGTPY